MHPSLPAHGPPPSCPWPSLFPPIALPFPAHCSPPSRPLLSPFPPNSLPLPAQFSPPSRPSLSLPPAHGPPPSCPTPSLTRPPTPVPTPGRTLRYDPHQRRAGHRGPHFPAQVQSAVLAGGHGGLRGSRGEAAQAARTLQGLGVREPHTTSTAATRFGACRHAVCSI
eukprot:360363-Chlamydomonas_euryale.AAC.6